MKVCDRCRKTKAIEAFNPRSAVVCHTCDLEVRAEADLVNKVITEGKRRHIHQNISFGFKVCKTCMEQKSLGDFPKILNGRYRSWCRLCYNERSRFYGRDWTRKNQEAQRAKERRRRAAKREAEGTHTIEDIARIRKAQKDRCCFPWCRAKLHGKGHIEHRVALAAGGTDDARNLQLSCLSCNSSKGTKDEIEFVQSRNWLI